MTVQAARSRDDLDVTPIKNAYTVSRLTLTDFRNYASLRMDIDSAPVILVGPNGAGKTNILEALSLLAPGRGMRGARYEELTCRGTESGWAVSAQVRCPGLGGEYTIGTGIISEDGSGPRSRRSVQVDNEKRQNSSLSQVLTVSWLTPQMDRLFQDDAASRRRFLDRLVCGRDAQHARRVAAYERTLRERSRLLRDGTGTDTWLSALEKTMVEHGVALAAARLETVVELSDQLVTPMGPFPGATIHLEGVVEKWLSEIPLSEAEHAFRSELSKSRFRDSKVGGAAVGPHRTDLKVGHLGNGMPASQCSTGEQKALLIAIFLADARMSSMRCNAAPLLLLDEVAAHLDDIYREALFSEIMSLGAQVWCTGTNLSVFHSIAPQAQVIQVKDGSVHPEAFK